MVGRMDEWMDRWMDGWVSAEPSNLTAAERHHHKE